MDWKQIDFTKQNITDETFQIIIWLFLPYGVTQQSIQGSVRQVVVTLVRMSILVEPFRRFTY